MDLLEAADRRAVEAEPGLEVVRRRARRAAASCAASAGQVDELQVDHLHAALGRRSRTPPRRSWRRGGRRLCALCVDTVLPPLTRCGASLYVLVPAVIRLKYVVSLEAEAEPFAAVGLVGRQARDLVDASQPVAHRVPMQVHRLGRLGGRSVVGQKGLQRRQKLGVVLGGRRRRAADDRVAVAQLLQLVRVPDQDPDQQPVGLLLPGQLASGYRGELDQQVGLPQRLVQRRRSRAARADSATRRSRGARSSAASPAPPRSTGGARQTRITPSRRPVAPLRRASRRAVRN